MARVSLHSCVIRTRRRMCSLGRVRASQHQDTLWTRELTFSSPVCPSSDPQSESAPDVSEAGLLRIFWWLPWFACTLATVLDTKPLLESSSRDLRLSVPLPPSAFFGSAANGFVTVNGFVSVAFADNKSCSSCFCRAAVLVCLSPFDSGCGVDASPLASEASAGMRLALCCEGVCLKFDGRASTSSNWPSRKAKRRTLLSNFS